MATCPKCRGHLTTGHRCRRTRRQQTWDQALAGIAGGVTALVMTAVFDRQQVVADYDGYIMAGGIALAMLTHSLLQTDEP